MKKLLFPVVLLFVLAGCTRKAGYECTCYNRSDKELGTTQFFDKETSNWSGTPELWAVDACNFGNVVGSPDTATYATCKRKRMEYDR